MPTRPEYPTCLYYCWISKMSTPSALSRPLLGDERQKSTEGVRLDVVVAAGEGSGDAGATGVADKDMYTQCDERDLQTDVETGLSSNEAERRLQVYGPNALPEEKKDPCVEFLSHFWGPMPIMIWVAIAIEILLAGVERKPTSLLDAGILFILQMLNGLVGWHEGKKAGDAIAALKDALSPRCSVVRDGREMANYDATLLVPGDIVKLSFGQAVPADVRIVGDREIRVDQAALTGESLPKRMAPRRHRKDGLYSYRRRVRGCRRRYGEPHVLRKDGCAD